MFNCFFINRQSDEANKIFRYILFTLIILAFCFPRFSHADDSEYPGTLVDIGTHRLHIHCTGTKSPSVIIDSGLGGFSLEWWQIQKTLSSQIRICSYDRAGYGWSDPGPMPRTTKQIAEELRLLLSNAHIPGPYILVGHSFGGFNIRYFASQNPELVAGMVLIDSSHPEQFDRFPAARPGPKTKRPNSINYTITRPVMPDNYPGQVKALGYRLMTSYKARATYIQESRSFRLSSEQVLAENHLPDIPLTILSRGKRVWPEDELGDQLEMIWVELQDELASLSSQTLHLSAQQSGHLIHLDQPELVALSILKTVSNVAAQKQIEIARADINRSSTSQANQSSLLYTLPTGTNNRYPLRRWIPEEDLSSGPYWH
ncbi:MAG: alpha/beta hydrolase [Gammaproteobacteria bacterium]